MSLLRDDAVEVLAEKLNDRANPDISWQLLVDEGNPCVEFIRDQARELLDAVTAPSSTEAPWRVGRKLKRTVYKQVAEESSDEDVYLGMMETPELAAAVVAAHNRERL